jgi:hypothetical protein
MLFDEVLMKFFLCRSFAPIVKKRRNSKGSKLVPNALDKCCTTSNHPMYVCLPPSHILAQAAQVEGVQLRGL